MLITINEKDINFAVTKFIKEQGFTGSVENIDFTMGRNGNGLTASIELTSTYSSGDDASIGRGVSTIKTASVTEETKTVLPFEKQTQEDVPTKEESTSKSVKSIFSTMHNPVN